MFSFARQNHHAVVKFNSESLRWPTVDSVGAQLLTVADRTDAKSLLLDFGDVEFVTGSGLGKLVALHQKVKAKGGRMAFTNVRPLVREVFAITGLNRVFEVQGHLPRL